LQLFERAFTGGHVLLRVLELLLQDQFPAFGQSELIEQIRVVCHLAIYQAQSRLVFALRQNQSHAVEQT
jgi:hypothetical protein